MVILLKLSKAALAKQLPPTRVPAICLYVVFMTNHMNLTLLGEAHHRYHLPLPMLPKWFWLLSSLLDLVAPPTSFESCMPGKLLPISQHSIHSHVKGQLPVHIHSQSSHSQAWISHGIVPFHTNRVPVMEAPRADTVNATGSSQLASSNYTRSSIINKDKGYQGNFHLKT